MHRFSKCHPIFFGMAPSVLIIIIFIFVGRTIASCSVQFDSVVAAVLRSSIDSLQIKILLYPEVWMPVGQSSEMLRLASCNVIWAFFFLVEPEEVDWILFIYLKPTII